MSISRVYQIEGYVLTGTPHCRHAFTDAKRSYGALMSLQGRDPIPSGESRPREMFTSLHRIKAPIINIKRH